MTYARPIGVSVIPDMFQPHEWDEFIARVALLKPSSAFVIGNLGRAYDIKSVCAPGAEVTYREIDPYQDRGKTVTFDNEFHQLHPDPKPVIDLALSRLGNAVGDFIIDYGWNEPGHDDSKPGKSLDQMLNWFIDAAYYARNKGMRITIGEFATDKSIKCFDVLDVQSGRWDNWLHMCDDIGRTWHRVRMHSYSAFVTLANQINFAGGDLLNRDFVQHDYWKGITLLTNRYLYNGAYVYPPYYNTGREIILLNMRAQEIGITSAIPYGLSECGLDTKPNLPGYEYAKTHFTQNPVGDPMRGYMGHFHYWAWIHGKQPHEYTADEFAEFYFKNIAAYVTSHPSNLLNVDPFTASMAGEWMNAGFNTNHPLNAAYWRHAAAFNDNYEALMSDPTIPETPDTPPVLGQDPATDDPRYPTPGDSGWQSGVAEKNHTGAYTFVRSTPRSVAGNIVGNISAPVAVKINLDDDYLIQDTKGNQWMPITLTIDGVYTVGWVAGNWISFVADPPVIDPDPDPEPDPDTPDPDQGDEGDTNDLLRQILDILKALARWLGIISVFALFLVGCTQPDFTTLTPAITIVAPTASDTATATGTPDPCAITGTLEPRDDPDPTPTREC